MICFPNAKINIGLNILRKREDGYHDIETLMYPLKGILCDALEIIESSKLKIESSGIRIPGNEDDNLCLKAYHMIKRDYPHVPPVTIHLHKAIPIGAGLGGGSSDAAFFIRLLNDTFELGISWGEMHHYARQLGSDCSFFVTNRSAYAEGKGDSLEGIGEIKEIEGKYIVIVCPDIHVNTAHAYNGVTPKTSVRSLENDLVQLPLKQWKDHIHNDFEDSVFVKYPEIKKIKEKLYSMGALYASMSGSGSAVYGIFEKETKAKNIFKGMQTFEGTLG